MSEYIVELRDVRKSFPGVVALDAMKLGVKPGEILGLIGENGAGKSTLIKVLTGVHRPDSGKIIVDGKERVFRNPEQAIEAGIACVYQELNIEKLLSVTDNIFINKWIRKGALLDYAAMHKKASELLKGLGLDVDVHKAAGLYGMGVQQMIEVSKALLTDAKCIIMDEPTSSLSEKEVEQLLKICRGLRERGIGILFVSHKLEELFLLCDRVTVIRDGKYVDTRETKDWDNDALIKAMVGRSLDTETMRAIFGADPIDSGEILVKGKKVKIRSPRDAIREKIAFLTEDRKGQGLVLAESIRNNLILANLKGFSRGLFLNKNKIRTQGEKRMSELSIKATGQEERVSQLSGGNQQKVVIGKWINTDADIYIFDEATRGIDVGAKVEVYQVINQLVKEGKCVIMVSSEMPEILGMSDRVIVMREGRITGEMGRETDAFNQEDVMKAAWEV